MLSIMQQHHARDPYLDFARGDRFYSGSQISALSTYQQKNTDITIVTAEGDKVTLSANSQQEASYLTYSSLVRRGGEMTQIQGKSYSMEVNQDFSITIEGDLNEEELQDIQESIKTIDKVMQATLSGNTDQALVMSQSVSDRESISGFSANMEIETAMSFAQQTTIQTQAAVSEPTTSLDTLLDPISQKRSNGSTEKMMEVLPHRGFRNKKLIKPLKKYFTKLFEGIPEKYKGSEKSEKLGLAHRLRSEILERIEKEYPGEINPSPDLDTELVIEEPKNTADTVKTAETVNPDEVEIEPLDAQIDEDQDPVEA